MYDKYMEMKLRGFVLLCCCITISVIFRSNYTKISVWRVNDQY